MIGQQIFPFAKKRAMSPFNTNYVSEKTLAFPWGDFFRRGSRASPRKAVQGGERFLREKELVVSGVSLSRCCKERMRVVGRRVGHKEVGTRVEAGTEQMSDDKNYNREE